MGIIPLNDKGEEDLGQSILLAIYDLKGDILKICFGADRPESFEAKPGSKQTLLVLKWAKR